MPRAEDDRSWDEFITRIGPMVMGASTYQWMLEHEQLLTHPKRWEVYYADRPCWVFTHRDLPGIPGVDVRFVQGDVRAAYDDMVNARPGQDTWLVGGGDLVGPFADADLLDQISLGMAPVTLGAGSRCCRDG